MLPLGMKIPNLKIISWSYRKTIFLIFKTVKFIIFDQYWKSFKDGILRLFYGIIKTKNNLMGNSFYWRLYLEDACFVAMNFQLAQVGRLILLGSTGKEPAYYISWVNSNKPFYEIFFLQQVLEQHDSAEMMTLSDFAGHSVFCKMKIQTTVAICAYNRVPPLIYIGHLGKNILQDSVPNNSENTIRCLFTARRIWNLTQKSKFSYLPVR